MPSFEYDATNRRWQGTPGIERTSKGRLWATWMADVAGGESAFNYVILADSTDNGETWSKPRMIIDPEWFVTAFNPMVWIDPLGRIWLFWSQSAGWRDGRFGVWAIVADDPDAEYPEWSAPRRISDGVLINKPIVVQSGAWLFPVAGWVSREPDLGLEGYYLAPHTKESLIHSPENNKGSNVYITQDAGETFTRVGWASIPETQYDEHMIVERKDGSLWMLARTTYGIGQATSDDGGRTWVSGPKFAVQNPSRFFIRRLDSGALILLRYNRPDDVDISHLPPAEQNRATRSYLTAFLSDDDGATWPYSLLIDNREWVSYPDGTQSEDGLIYVIYDRERSVAREILMAVFREEDVRAGRIVSNDSRFRVVVNRAGQ